MQPIPTAKNIARRNGLNWEKIRYVRAHKRAQACRYYFIRGIKGAPFKNHADMYNPPFSLPDMPRGIGEY